MFIELIGKLPVFWILCNYLWFSCSLTASSIHYFVPYGIGTAARFDQCLISIAFTYHYVIINVWFCLIMYWDICNSLFCSTRVSNELGAGNPQAARLAACAVMVLAVTEAVIVSTTLFFCRNVLAYAFNSDKEVVNYVAELVPLLCLSIMMDSLQAVLSG